MLPFAEVNEREIYHDYDRDRRLRITRNLAFAFFIMLILALISTPFTLGIHPSIEGLAKALWPPLLAVAAFGLSWWLTLRRQDIMAAALLLSGTLFVVVDFQIQYALRDGVGPLTLAIMTAYGINIANAGIIGNTWLIWLVTVIENALTAFLLIGLPLLIGQSFMPQLTVVLFTLLMVQWGMAVSFSVGRRQNLRTLRELGDIRVAYARAQQVEEIKNQFITSVNHELRTPVMTMIGWIENLQSNAAQIADTASDGNTQTDASKMLANLKRAEAAGLSLTALINSILDVNRLDQDLTQFTPQSVIVSEAVQAAIALLEPAVGAQQERAISLDLEPNLAIYGEAVWLQQIFGNLLSNAIKYSAPATAIEVHACVVTEQRGRREQVQVVECTIRDYGLGVPPAQIPLLFQKFVRLPRDLASTTIGNGLGLWLCKQLTEAMGGRIWIDSTGVAGEGSTFFVRLPLAPVASAAVPRQPIEVISVSAEHTL